MLNLSNVTAICVDGTPEGNRNFRLVEIIKNMKTRIKFHDIFYFSHVNPKCEELCSIIPIQKIQSLSEYSGFVILNLPNYIKSEFCMIFHDDGFPINLHLWRNEFLNFDYIGAPWGSSCSPPVFPHNYYNNEVDGGNGGFSIRSNRLMQYGKEIADKISGKITMQEYVSNGGWIHEDGYFCYQIRPFLKKMGIKYAPYQISKQFALETNLDDSSNNIEEVFGFHGFRHINFDEGIKMLKKPLFPRQV